MGTAVGPGKCAWPWPILAGRLHSSVVGRHQVPLETSPVGKSQGGALGFSSNSLPPAAEK